jgi:hypothetical protein
LKKYIFKFNRSKFLFMKLLIKSKKSPSSIRLNPEENYQINIQKIFSHFSNNFYKFLIFIWVFLLEKMLKYSRNICILSLKKFFQHLLNSKRGGNGFVAPRFSRTNLPWKLDAYNWYRSFPAPPNRLAESDQPNPLTPHSILIFKLHQQPRVIYKFSHFLAQYKMMRIFISFGLYLHDNDKIIE